ncbi:uncharacterized protein zgc:113208 [Osmerus eperlanus]|uniref:uncharacterized protein zgc:113208 n=1 Tax=Osmerus eperlanus TaxID=29151 RepID=UPI002E111DE8
MEKGKNKKITARAKRKAPSSVDESVAGKKLKTKDDGKTNHDQIPASSKALSTKSAKKTIVKEKKVMDDSLQKKRKRLDSSVSQSSKDSCKKKTQDGGPEVERNGKGELVFTGFPMFRPNMTPKEVLQAGSFGGTYFRSIHSRVTKKNYKDVWKELPEDWLKNLDIPKQVASSVYREDVNTYKVKCGGSLEMWESSGWIVTQDPYGWFQWYCRFYQGRRTQDDERQVGRWAKCTGLRGRWKNNLITKIVRSGSGFDNLAVSPVVRQTLQHWGYRLTREDYVEGAKRVKSS